MLLIAQYVIIVRLSDELILTESIKNKEFIHNWKSKCSIVVKGLRNQMNSDGNNDKITVEVDSSYSFHVLIEMGIAYIALGDKFLSKKLIYSFLENLKDEFIKIHSMSSIMSTTRPYAFITFEREIDKLMRQYQKSSSTVSNSASASGNSLMERDGLSRLRENLQDVSAVLQTNIKEIAERGNSLEKMSLISSLLATESERFKKETKMMNLRLMYQKYGGMAIVGGIVIIVLYVWWKLC